MTKTEKLEILSEVKTMSYGLVAERHGITRNVVAGIVWRHNNPPPTRVNADGKREGGSYNRNGRGYGTGIYAPLTLQNTRA